MKKFLVFTLTILAAFACIFAAACDREPVKADENTVFIKVTDKSYVGKTLLEYMERLSDEGRLTFEINDGMMTSINGKSNALNSYWMLYTDDAENANDEWGKFEHEDKTYGSAVLGASELTVREGCLYVWAYQKF